MYKNHITTVLGLRGSGKSTWLLKNLDSFQPFLLIDPLEDDRFKEIEIYRIKSPDEALQLFKHKNPQRLIVSPNLIQFDWLCGLCLAKQNMTLIVDEVDQYASNYYISPYFKKVLKYGRHRRVNLVMVARRFKEIHPLLRSQSTRFIIFPLSGEDTRELAQEIGKQAFLVEKLHSTPNVETDYIDYNRNDREATIKCMKYSLDK